MHPVLLNIGGFSLPSYGVMVLLGVVCAYFVGRHLAKVQDLPWNVLSDAALYTLLVALIGARLLLIVTDLDLFLKNPRHFLSMLTTAGNFFGGLMAGALFFIYYIRRRRLPLLPVLDLAAVTVAFGHAFGRLGCLMAGCCWGRPAPSCSLAIRFHDPSARTGVPLDVPLYPTQAAEAGFNLLLGLTLLFLSQRDHHPGRILSFYLMGYGSYRFISEYYRGDTGRGYLFGDMTHPFSSLSIPQLMSIAAVLIGVFLYRYARKKTS